MTAGPDDPQGRSAWLVDGDDPSLVGEAVRSLVDELLGGADRSVAVEEYAGDEVDLSAVADACRTPAFLADRRIVVLRDAGQWALWFRVGAAARDAAAARPEPQRAA